MNTRREVLKAHQDLATSIEVISPLHPAIKVCRSASAYFLNAYFCNHNHLISSVRFALRVHQPSTGIRQLDNVGAPLIGKSVTKSLCSTMDEEQSTTFHRIAALVASSNTLTLEHSSGSAGASCRCSRGIFDSDCDQEEIHVKHVPEMLVELLAMFDRYLRQFTPKRFSWSVCKCC